VDSREVSLTDKKQIKAWIDDYGEDSDFVRVRVRGVFPRVDSESFISFEVALEATRRTPLPSSEPIVIGADVGRFGDDPSVIYCRKGRDAQSIVPDVYYGMDTMTFAAKIAAKKLDTHASAVFVDGGGVGGGVVDRLRVLGVPVISVDFGSKADYWDQNDGTKYANKRAEIWGGMKAWLSTGCIPETVRGLEVSIVDELTGPKFGLNGNEEIQLEKKKDMRRRGVKSPNLADALACTFAMPVYVPTAQEQINRAKKMTEDYNPYSKERMVA
jgi:hypothetical protein